MSLSPHFSRIFSAVTLWIALLAFFVVNLVNGISEPKRVLGASSAGERESAERAFGFWQEVVKTKPSYRDGFVTLATLAYQLGKFDEATAFADRALTLDPNSPDAQRLLEIISSLPSSLGP